MKNNIDPMRDPVKAKAGDFYRERYMDLRLYKSLK
jgi:hypothetical protein